MSSQSVFLAMLLVGCSVPTTAVRPSAVTPTTVSVGVENTPKPCPPTEENHLGYRMNLDYARFVCLGTTLATCYKEQPIWQVACGREAANQLVISGAHCKLPRQAKSFLMVQGGYTEKEDVIAGHYVEGALVDGPVVAVCGNQLPKN